MLSTPDIQERHRRVCFIYADVTECHTEENTAIEAVAVREFPNQSAMRVPSFPTPRARSLLVARDIGAVLPPVPKQFLLWTTYVGLISVLLLPSIAAYVLDPNIDRLIPHPPEPTWLFVVSQAVDPLLIHFISYLAIIWILYHIALGKNFSQSQAISLAVVLPAAIVLVDFLINNYLAKPALAFPRESSYDPNLEPVLTRYVMRFLGVSDAVPSGFVGRQFTLSLLVYWLGLHFKNPWRDSLKYLLLNLLNTLALFLVILQRLYIGA